MFKSKRSTSHSHKKALMYGERICFGMFGEKDLTQEQKLLQGLLKRKGSKEKGHWS